ncbi:MAG: hypothetical protein JWP69_2092 [Flaviaesturariibacter sp.]|nr:hypothetical protein [Flaviaesturariibacter sp.]
MRLDRIVVFVLSIAITACKTGSPGLFGKSSPHEQYARKLTDAGLASTSLGSLWFAAAEKALAQPQPVSLPYKQHGYFAADKPRAVGISFTARRGEKLLFQLERKPLNPFHIYADLWQMKTGAKPVRLLFADSTKPAFDYEVDEAGTYLLRLQPELLRSGEYTISISVGPSLGFPVAGSAAKVGSIWGDDRDGGSRRHDGIDIFAPKRTPVVAAGAGTVGRVNETAIGGKVVWMRPTDKNINLYYAHLDEQLVSPGQRVEAGDTLGLLGNTGNARTTPSHLHFGIYATGGPVDPLPFVNRTVKEPTAISFNKPLNNYYRLNTDLKVAGQTIPKNTVGVISDAGEKQVFLELPDAKLVQIPSANIQSSDNQVLTLKLHDSLRLLDAPFITAAGKTSLEKGVSIKVLGYFNEFAYIQAGTETGWIPKGALR